MEQEYIPVETHKDSYERPVLREFAWDFERQDNLGGVEKLAWSSFRNDSNCASVSPVVLKKKE